jgi:hypothetical protein
VSGAPKATRLSQIRHLSFSCNEQFISFVLKLLKRYLPAGVGLQMCVELIVLLQTGFAGRVRGNTGTEFLKMHTDAVERQVASAMGTFNSSQFFTRVLSFRDVMNSRTSSIEENTLSLLRELQG